MGKRLSQSQEQELGEKLRDQQWRLNNLYYIQDEKGNKVLFKMREVQQDIYDNMWFWNLYLKSRQHGVTTFWCIYMLDQCLFYDNQACGLIAHRLPDAKKIFQTKIKFPYDNLPPLLKKARALKTETKEELTFNNDSAIYVSTSMRSGTCQILHISEFGYTCAKHPDKAQEIISGGLNAVHEGAMVNIESTAAGRAGKFYDYSKDSHRDMMMGKKLTKLDFKFHFYAWWQDPKNAIGAEGIVIYPFMQTYFDKLKDKHKLELSMRQKAWYIARQSKDPEGMKAEHPSTWEEAFEVSIEGAFFKREFEELYARPGIIKVPYQPTAMVDTFWDIGVNDKTVIWFTQTIGRQVHVINYFEASNEGIKYYADMLAEFKEKNSYQYGTHWAPHDIKVKEFGSGRTRLDTAKSLGIIFSIAKRVAKKGDGIQAIKNILPICYFDEEKCAVGIAHLENYRKEWDDIKGEFKDRPLHNSASHAADAFQTLATSHLLKPVSTSQKPMRRGGRSRINNAAWC